MDSKTDQQIWNPPKYRLLEQVNRQTLILDQSNGRMPGTKFEQGSFLLHWYEKTFLNIILKIEIRQMMGTNVNLHISKMAVFVIFFTGSTILKPYYTVLIHFPALWDIQDGVQNGCQIT